MFDIGWTEMLVIAVVMIVVVGPKDLPKMLRTFGKTTAKMRSMAGDFQKQFNEALKEAELDDIKKSVDTLKGLNPATEIKKQLNPFEKAASDVRAGLDATMKPKPADVAPAAVAAEPLKNGPVSETPSSAMPGASAPLPQAAAASPDPAAPPPQAQPAAAAAAVAEAAEKPVAKSAGAKAAGPKAAPKGARTPAKPAAAKAKAAPRKKSESSAT
jgi:sec-independent protein translocase protein TatB